MERPTPDPGPCLSHSFKFGRKIFYVNYLSELSEHVKLEQLGIPRQVLKCVGVGGTGRGGLEGLRGGADQVNGEAWEGQQMKGVADGPGRASLLPFLQAGTEPGQLRYPGPYTAWVRFLPLGSATSGFLLSQTLGDSDG